jgi:hypothetical protein
MSNLSEISIDKIDTDVMSVLYANIDKKFSQYTLFNKLLEDKYEGQYTNSIHPNFKSKFLLVIRTLMSKYDDIVVEKKDGLYYIVCLSSKEDKEEKPLYMEHISKPIQLGVSDTADMYDYIYDNDLNEYMIWSDPFDGNSIFHELVLNNNIKQTSRLIGENRFNFEIKNNQNQTPIDLINSQEMGNLIIKEFIKKIMVLTEKYNQEKANVESLVVNFNKKIDYYESNEYKNKIIYDTSFYDIVMEKTRKYHWPVKMYLFSFIVCYLAMRMIF